MFTCSDKAKVEAIYSANMARTVDEIMLATFPDATIDSNGRYHAPHDGYTCELTGRVFRGGEYLPVTEEGNEYKGYMTQAKVDGEVVTWYGTKAQIAAVRSELRNQSNAIDAAASVYVGEIGEKIYPVNVTIEAVMSFCGMYGTTYIIVMKDEANNVLVYKGSKLIGERDTKAVIGFKVKAHNERDGVKQTIVERPYHYNKPTE